MKKIKILPAEMVTKIAAGEVIERPASVVKELIENSYDAGAAAITVEIKKSGRELISVSDDGTGMGREDIATAAERHSTSKISGIPDLEKITTFGFRGEALPSIASIAAVKITSKAEDESPGTEIELAGGKIISKRDAAVPRGTTVEVRDLFGGIPARLKFLKSDTTEKSKIISCITEYVVVNFRTSVRLISDGKEMFFYPAAGDLKTRLAQIFGAEFGSELLPVEARHENMSLEGFISRPGKTFLNRNRIFTFANGRPISSRSLVRAVKNGYGEFLRQGENPAMFLMVSVNPADMDVNVHPTKREIKFRDENAVYSLVYQTVRSGLLTASAIPSIGVNTNGSAVLPPVPEYEYRTQPSENAARNSFAGSPKAIYVTQELTKAGMLRPKYVGRAFELYIIAEHEGDVLIIDQHAAQEKILYEKFMKDIKEKSLKVQNLLIPVNIDLSPKEFGILAGLKDTLGKIGFEVEEFGRSSFVVKAVPELIGGAGVASVISEIISREKVGSIGEASEKIVEDITQAACKTAIKAGDKLSEAETAKLLDDLLRCENPYVCPHGRPTMIKLSKDELDRKFLRK